MLDFKQLSNKYGNFALPKAKILINQKEFALNQGSFILSDLEIELTSGLEASMANFRIYNILNESQEIKFDDLKDYILLGSSVDISLGYQEEFTQVFWGFISNLSFSFMEQEIPYIEVNAMDVKGVMMSTRSAKQLKATSYGEAVKEVLTRAAYEKLLSAGIIKGMTISDTPDKQQGNSNTPSSETIEMVGESDYEFVVKASKKFNFEFFTESGKLLFREAKSVTEELMVLSFAGGLLAVTVGYDITGITEGVEVRAMDTGKGEAIQAKKTYDGTISNGSKAKGLIGKSEKVYIDPTVTSANMADIRSKHLLEEMSYRLGSLSCTCVGLPELLPGRFMSVSGIGTPVNNKYYITSVRHVFNEEIGYRTMLTGKTSTMKT